MSEVSPPTTRPVKARRLTFPQWCTLKAVDSTRLATEYDVAQAIGLSLAPRGGYLTKRSRGIRDFHMRKVEYTNALYRKYTAEVPEEIVGYRPLDLNTAVDQAYLRCWERRRRD